MKPNSDYNANCKADELHDARNASQEGTPMTDDEMDALYNEIMDAAAFEVAWRDRYAAPQLDTTEPGEPF